MKWHRAALQMAEIVYHTGRLVQSIGVLPLGPGHELIQDPARRRPLSIYPLLRRPKMS